MTLASPLKTVIGRDGSIIRYGGNGKKSKVRANGADLFIGAIVTRVGETEDDPDVDLCAKGEAPSGIILGPADDAIDLDKDSDDCFADDTWLLMYEWERNDEIYLTVKTNTALTVYVEVQVDGGFIIPWAYVNASEATDTRIGVMGACQNAVSAVASTETVVLVKMGA
jgi:hypothetical protein